MFRPCIDIHNGAVKQIVGSSLKDSTDYASENFVSEKGAGDFALMYKEYGFKGGHVILLNGKDSSYYDATKAQALAGLKAYPGGLMAGGGMDEDNAVSFLDAGASHIIYTSYVFKDGMILYDRLDQLVKKLGKKRICLDLSVRRANDGSYYVMTDRWQVQSKEILTKEMLNELCVYCDEYLIHATDVEGKKAGIDKDLLTMLYAYRKEGGENPITYAGGIGSLDDLKEFRMISSDMVDYTIGSALSIFGGTIGLDALS